MTITAPKTHPRRTLSPEEKKYWRVWSMVCKSQGWKHGDNERRRALHREADCPASMKDFTHADFDRFFAAARLLINMADLDSAVEKVAYEAHDAAQAAHEPEIRSGARRRRPREYASRYEHLTPKDDPGERRRLLYVITRLFEPALIASLSRDLFGARAEWRDLPIPELTLLRDALKRLLGKWLTIAKQHDAAPGHDQLAGIDLTSRNPRSPTGIATNEEIIKQLLKRGRPIRLVKERQGEMSL